MNDMTITKEMLVSACEMYNDLYGNDFDISDPEDIKLLSECFESRCSSFDAFLRKLAI